jgi:hypothetical protein
MIPHPYFYMLPALAVAALYLAAVYCKEIVTAIRKK